MNSRIIVVSSILVMAFSVTRPTQGQIPDWQTNKQLSVSSYVVCAAADGYGLHVLVPNGNTYRHYLLG